jgi:tetrahydromethanopterin S-methyltransferase subunit B
MRRRIGAMVVTELTIVTFVDDAMMIGRRELRDITLVLIDPVEERVEGWTEIETAAAAVADIVDPQRFLFECGRIDRLEETKFFH